MPPLSCGLVLKCVAGNCMPVMPGRVLPVTHLPVDVWAMLCRDLLVPACPVHLCAVCGRHLRLLNWSNTLSAVRQVRGQHCRALLLPGRQRGGDNSACACVAGYYLFNGCVQCPAHTTSVQGGVRVVTPRPSRSCSSSTSTTCRRRPQPRGC